MNGFDREPLDTTSSASERVFKERIERLTGLSFDKVRCDGIPLISASHSSSRVQWISALRSDFEKGQLHDRIKVARCRELGLTLIGIEGSHIDVSQGLDCPWTALGLMGAQLSNKVLLRNPW